MYHENVGIKSASCRCRNCWRTSNKKRTELSHLFVFAFIYEASFPYYLVNNDQQTGLLHLSPIHFNKLILFLQHDKPPSIYLINLLYTYISMLRLLTLLILIELHIKMSYESITRYGEHKYNENGLSSVTLHLHYITHFGICNMHHTTHNSIQIYHKQR